jgi:hypothetical protein
MMKLRFDLVAHLSAEDVAQEAEATVHRFMPEPRFPKTGTGSLSPTSIEELANEAERSMERTARLESRAKPNGSGSGAAH